MINVTKDNDKKEIWERNNIITSLSMSGSFPDTRAANNKTRFTTLKQINS